MIQSFDSMMHSFRLLCAAILMLAIGILISILVSAPQDNKVEAKELNSRSSKTERPALNSPNVVANGMSLLAYQTSQAADTIATSASQAGSTITNGAEAAMSATANAIKNTGATVGQAVQTGTIAVGRAVGSGASFVVSIPGSALQAVSKTAAVRTVIRPSDHVEVPIIDPGSPELKQALAALPADDEANKESTDGTVKPVWPINGSITTQFGVDHRPFQYTHSGIDISDGQAPGITPIRPFRPGRVIETNYSGYGLGNHVIVDHGNGVTSVYAHLASIAVSANQKVDQATTLGYQGSTGTSTGSHLHFEIRVNGQATDPAQFIAGRP